MAGREVLFHMFAIVDGAAATVDQGNMGALVHPATLLRGDEDMASPDEMGLTPDAARGYEQFFVPSIFHQWPPLIAAEAAIQQRR